MRKYFIFLLLVTYITLALFNGCKKELSCEGAVSDEIIIKEGICDIYFPSAFTPNK